MFQITINEKGGPSRQETFDKGEITIGRVQGNDIILPKGNISKRHSRIVVKDGKFIIVDLKSTNGTYVNGKKITAPQVVKASDKIYIGDYTIQLGANGAAAPSAEPAEAGVKGRGPQREEEIDLFGGDAELPPAEAPRQGSPGLIDDNFDQEFDAPAPTPVPAPRPAPKAPVPPKKPAARAPEPEPEPEPEGALEDELQGALRLEGDALGDGDLDLADDGAGFDPPEPDPEPEPEPAPKFAKLPPRKAPAPAPAAASTAVPAAPAQVAPAATGAAAGRSLPLRGRPLPGRTRPEADEALAAESMRSPELTVAPELAPPTQLPVPAATQPPAPAVALAATVMPAVVAAAPAARPMERARLFEEVHREVVATAGLSGEPVHRLGDRLDAARSAARGALHRLRAAGAVAPGEDVEALASEIAGLATDVSAIGDLLGDAGVVEVVVTCDRQVLADREGHLEPTGRSVDSEAEVVALVQKLAMLAGVAAGPEAPLVDVRLRDGARLVAALPPLAFRGPTLTYRKTTRDFFTLDKLLEYSTISPAILTFLDYCLRFRKNLLLSVGPGVSPTATLNALVAQTPTDDRLVTVERGVELHVGPPRNVTALEPRAGVPMGRLLDYAVSLQADRLVLGALEPDALADVVRVVTGPLEGSIASIAAPTPAEAIERLARGMASSAEMPLEDARRAIARAFPVVLQEQRFLDNSRRIVAVAEVVVDEGEVRVEDIFSFSSDGVDENLLVTGSFRSTGYMPRFLEELLDRGEAEIDAELFKA